MTCRLASTVSASAPSISCEETGTHDLSRTVRRDRVTDGIIIQGQNHSLAPRVHLVHITHIWTMSCVPFHMASDIWLLGKDRLDGREVLPTLQELG